MWSKNPKIQIGLNLNGTNHKDGTCPAVVVVSIRLKPPVISIAPGCRQWKQDGRHENSNNKINIDIVRLVGASGYCGTDKQNDCTLKRKFLVKGMMYKEAYLNGVFLKVKGVHSVQKCCAFVRQNWMAFAVYDSVTNQPKHERDCWDEIWKDP